MLFKKQKFDWMTVALLALGLFLYVSYQPRFRLHPAMPPDFIDETLARPSQKSDLETKIAGAYWSCLANNIQWQYGHGHALPVDPPPDFTVTGASGMAADDTATRVRYWRRAQHIWYLPTSWQKNYEWNFDWTTDWIQNGGDALHHLFERLGN
jgi:hypothetical protein